MKKTETEQILEYLKHIDESINGPRPKARPSTKEPPLSKRVDRLDEKVEGLDRKVDAQFQKVDKRFDKVDRSIETTRVQLVGLVELVHNELTGRIIDLEGPGTKGSGGGVPLAS